MNTEIEANVQAARDRCLAEARKMLQAGQSVVDVHEVLSWTEDYHTLWDPEWDDARAAIDKIEEELRGSRTSQPSGNQTSLPDRSLHRSDALSAAEKPSAVERGIAEARSRYLLEDSHNTGWVVQADYFRDYAGKTAIIGSSAATKPFLADMAARWTAELPWITGAPNGVPTEDFGEVIYVGDCDLAAFDKTGGQREHLYRVRTPATIDELLTVPDQIDVYAGLLIVEHLQPLVGKAAERDKTKALAALEKLQSVCNALVYGWPRSLRGVYGGEYWATAADVAFSIETRGDQFAVVPLKAGQAFQFKIEHGVLQPATAVDKVTVAGWLEGLLLTGPKPRTEIMAAGAALGFTERQIKYAAGQLGLTLHRVGMPAVGVWELPGWNL